MNIALILAMARNGAIGQQHGRHGLPWHIPQDLRWFREHTWQKTVIMGRRTHQAIGRPLPQRRNVVLSRDQHAHWPGCDVAHSWEQALTMVDDEVMVIGGATLFRLAWPLAQRCYLTRVLADVDGDTYLHDLNWEQWQLVTHLKPDQGAASHPFEHLIYHRSQL